MIEHSHTIMSANSNQGFCLFNELYADCVVIQTDSAAVKSAASYLVMDGELSYFFSGLLETASQNQVMTALDLSFADSDLAWQKGNNDAYSQQLGVLSNWHVTYEDAYDFKVIAHRFLPRVESQTGSDMREYKGMNITAMLFFAQKSGNVFYSNQSIILLRSVCLSLGFTVFILTSLI